MSERDLPIVILGSGGHALVVLDACMKAGRPVAGYLGSETKGFAAKWLGGDEMLQDADFRRRHCFHIGIGDIARRRVVGERLGELGAHSATIAHPSVSLGMDVRVEDGSFLGAGAILGPRCRIGRHSIVNTRASIDHECVLGDYSHVGPGATLAGGVVCGAATLIGVGAAVKPLIRIGSSVVVGAGGVVVSDLPDAVTAFGCPARPCG